VGSSESHEKQVGPEELKAEVIQSVREEAHRGPNSRPNHASASYNISPDSIPGESSNKEQLLQELAKQFGCRYSPPAIPPEAQGSQVSIDTLMKFSLDRGDPVEFTGGRLQFPGSDRITPINRIGFGEQSLSARVNGISAEAEYLCKQLCLLLWECTGITRRWDEFEDDVEFVAYQTSTIVDLGVPLKSLLSESFRGFLTDDVSAPGGFGEKMGSRSVDIVPASDLLVVSHCRSMDLRVSVIDKVSGRAEDCLIEFLTHTRSDGNRSRLKISSELESQQHERMVSALTRRIRESA
jgi:hypothetical protein